MWSKAGGEEAEVSFRVGVGYIAVPRPSATANSERKENGDHVRGVLRAVDTEDVIA